MNQATLDFIRCHATDDVRQLAFRSAPVDVDLHEALQQIEGRQLAARKLPAWAATDGLLFPPRLALEQCSSEATAAYKLSVAKRLLADNGGDCFVDLTAGFGVDFATLAPLFQEAIYVDCNPDLCDVARHNMSILGLAHADVRCATAEDVLNELTDSSQTPVSLLMIDPARRDSAGRKVAFIEDCTPDVCALQGRLRATARWTLIKLSPMLDLTAALRSLHGVVEAHVISVGGECKELLLVMAGETENVPLNAPDSVPIHCIDLPLHYPAEPAPSAFVFTHAEEAEGPSPQPSPLNRATDVSPSFLYEPSACLLKAGAFRTVCRRFPVCKLAPMSHLYVADRPVDGFPGRAWRIVDSATFAKHDLRRLLQGVEAAELSVRGFPTSVAALRRQLRLREGGTAHFIATTLADGTRVLLRVERESKTNNE